MKIRINNRINDMPGRCSSSVELTLLAVLTLVAVSQPGRCSSSVALTPPEGAKTT